MMKLHRTLVLVLMVAILAFAGCSQSEPAPQEVQPNTSADVQTQAEVVATVNGQEITAQDVANAQQTLTQQTGQEIGTDQAFQALIQQVLIEQEIQERGIEVSVEEAQAEIESQLQAQGISIEQYQEQVGMDVYTQTVRQAQEQLALSALVNELEIPEVTQNDTRTFFDENPEQFVMGNETISYEQAQADIEAFLEQQYQQQALRNLIGNLSEQANIQQ